MNLWRPILCLVLLAPAVRAADKASPAGGGAVLEVSTLAREADRLKAPVRVEGVVSKVFPKEHRLGLIDAAEFKRCGGVTCADLVLPVQWSGAMPEVKSLVRASGEIRRRGETMEFVATSLEKVPAR